MVEEIITELPVYVYIQSLMEEIIFLAGFKLRGII